MYVYSYSQHTTLSISVGYSFKRIAIKVLQRAYGTFEAIIINIICVNLLFYLMQVIVSNPEISEVKTMTKY